MALIQIHVDDDIKKKADAAFARNGLTTPMAMRVMVTQVANEGRTPFDGLFVGQSGSEYIESIRRDMLYAEAQEYGLIPDDSIIGSEIPDSVLEELGLTAEEVGQ